MPFCAHPVPTGAVPVVARPGHRLPGAAGKGTDFDSGPSVPGPTRARPRGAAYHGKALLVPATTITTRPPGQRRPLRAGAATHGQAVLEMVQERGDEWGVKVFDLQFRR